MCKVGSKLFDEAGEVEEIDGTKFLKSCEGLHELLYVLIKVCSGAPGRATEVGVVQVCNTVEASRNVFVSGPLFLPVYYH